MDAKKKGDTGEQAVNSIASKTYLKYWCYPNPLDELGDKKEICDLLIQFKNTLIIFSVKNYSFDGNYLRYFRNTLNKAVNQIHGAERKIVNGKRSISIKHPEKGIEEIDPSKISDIHRIIVNLNTRPLFYPGGRITKGKNYVHILNWNSFLRLVIELDTIPDFIDYLKTREAIFAKRELILLTGAESDYLPETNIQLIQYTENQHQEEKPYLLLSGNELDLLADYYLNDRQFNKHISSLEYDGMSYEMDGKWEEYLQKKEVIRKKNDDKYSYFVDEFVRREVLYKSSQMNLELATELLSLSRFERRMLGKQFYDFHTKYQKEDGRFIARRYGYFEDVIICFMIYGSKAFSPEEATLPLSIAGQGFCYWEGYKTKKLILIGFNNLGSGFIFGFDKDVKPLPTKEHDQLIRDIEMLNWFRDMNQTLFTLKEYPDE